MSYFASAIVTQCAILTGDPLFRRVASAEWPGFIDMAARKLCKEHKIIVRRATFTLAQDVEVYSYPDDVVQIQRLEVTDTPTDVTTYRKVREMNREEWERATYATYPTGSIPLRYFPDTSHYFLDVRPEADIVAGGRLTYWATPDPIDDPSYYTVEMPDMLRERLVATACMFACLKLEDYERMAALQQQIAEDEALTATRMQDRSDDRRSGLRVTRDVSGFGSAT